MSSSLGKRKEREGDVASEDGAGSTHGSTLFVSNLPYTATSTDIQTLFSDIAPIRSAFVVLEHGTGTSKGVGYVSFAIREDASMAFEKITKEGITLDGRSLRVQWAGQKPKDKTQRVKTENPEVKETNPTAPHPRTPSTSGDPLAIRTVVIGGLPSSIDSKALWKKVRKLEGAEKVEWPVRSDSGSEDPTSAHALFVTPAAASHAIEKLHAHVFKGCLLSATLKKRLDGLAKAALMSKKGAASASTKKGPAPSRASRLIVRNLPFDITEQDLRALFLPYGPVHLIDLPRVDAVKGDTEGEEDGEKGKGRIKGFAFVWMLSKKDAEHAMEACNGMEVQGGVAQRIVSDKQKRKKQLREEAKLQKAAKKEDGAEGEGEEVEEVEEEDGVGERNKRVIAVDWALSKDQWEKAKAKTQEEGADEDVEMNEGDAGGEESGETNEDEDEDSSGEDEEDSHLGVHDNEDESDEGGSLDEEGDEDEEKPSRPTLPPPEAGTTLFIRNIPFEATDDELRVLFRAFGPLRYARVAMDPVTGRSRGTGFACFWNKADADKAIEQSEILRAETVGEHTVAAPKKNPFKLPSLLTPDPSASIAQNLVLHGRTLDVIRAVTRDEAGKLKEAGERQREKADKRNLYLLREGIILPNTPAAEALPPAEVEKRTTSFNARRALLKSNPSLFVSRTRLSIRQLPLFATERMLKRLGVHAVRAFERDVQAGVRQALTEDELAEPIPEEGDVEGEDATNREEGVKGKGKGKDKIRKGKGRETGVKQAKIVRQSDRVDPATGRGRSKGYGFLELTTHADALRVLRWTNNNPAVGPLFEGWWREEMQQLLDAEKGKKDKDEARVKRLREELERGVTGRGTLIVEFSIENVQVVQRRATKQRDAKQGVAEPKKRKMLDATTKREVKKEDAEAALHPAKRRRVSDAHPQAKGNGDKIRPKSEGKGEKGANEEKPVQKVGSLIGRKRKERKMKRAKSG